MIETDNEQPHLRNAGRQLFPLNASCSIGRAATNSVVLSDANVSRKHAIIHPQNGGEFWLIDLGSSNGTFLNGRKLIHATRLSDRDEIGVGEATFTFSCPSHVAEHLRTTLAQQTIQRTENTWCWLLLADIENFTPLSQSLPSEDLSVLLGRWMSACREAIERHHGTINKYLGDGLFAYWKGGTELASHVAKAIVELRTLQHAGSPAFRVIVHFGRVFIGGVPSMGEESVIGQEVNLAFRLEKLAGALGTYIAASASAAEELQHLFVRRSLGNHALKGVGEAIELFALD